MEHEVREVEIGRGGPRGLLIDVPGANVFSYDFSLRGGFHYAPAGIREVPHVMEHMLCGANEEFKTSRAFEAEVKRNGASTNAYTSTWDIGYVGQCAKFEWDRMLSLLMLSMSKPLFLEREFKAEVGNIKEELLGLQSDYFRQLIIEMLIRLGVDAQTLSESILELPKVKLDDVKNHYKNSHHLGNVRFLIAGDLKDKADKIEQTIKDELVLPDGPRPSLPASKLTRQKKPLIITNETVPALHLIFSLALPCRISDQEADAMALLNSILTGNMDALIMGELRERGLAYHISSSCSRGNDYSTWSFGLQISSENSPECIRVIKKYLKLILDRGLSIELLEKAQDFNLGRYQMSGQTVGSLLGFYASRYSLMGDYRDFLSLPNYISAVTLDDIYKISSQFLEEAHWDLGVLGNTGTSLVDELYSDLADLWP